VAWALLSRSVFVAGEAVHGDDLDLVAKRWGLVGQPGRESRR
jgi:hypothetical protein